MNYRDRRGEWGGEGFVYSSREAPCLTLTAAETGQVGRTLRSSARPEDLPIHPLREPPPSHPFTRTKMVQRERKNFFHLSK